MKKILYVVTSILLVVILSGCNNNKELKKIYDNMVIGSNGINGYNLSIRLFGTIKENNISEKVFITNYMNTSYLVRTDTNIYYLTKDGKFIEQIEDDMFFKRGEEKFDRESVREEYNKDIPFTNTLIYLVPLKNSTPDDKAVEETIDNVEYRRYTFKVNKKDASKLLQDTSLVEEEIVGNVYGKVYIDSNDYVYKVEYDYSSAFSDSSNIKLIALFNLVNEVEEIELYD